MKTKFITRIFNGDFNMRTIEEDASEDPNFSVAQVVALATGDPRLMEYVEIEAKLQMHNMLVAAYRQELDQILNNRIASHSKTCIPRIEEELKWRNEITQNDKPIIDLAKQGLESCTGENFQIIIRDRLYDNRINASKALWEIAEQMENDRQERGAAALQDIVGSFGGFTLLVQVEGTANYFLLRHPETDQEIDCRMRRDIRDCMPKLEKRLAKITEANWDNEEKLIEWQGYLEQARKTVEELQHKIDVLTIAIATDEVVKQELEEVLGIQDDATADINFDDDDE